MTLHHLITSVCRWFGFIVIFALTACAEFSRPFYFDVDGYRDYLSVAQDDPMCKHMRTLHAGIDEEAEPLDSGARDDVLNLIRVEGDIAKNGDILWPFRKSLICAYLDAADEEKDRFRYTAVDAYTRRARWAAQNMQSEDGRTPLVPIYDRNFGRKPETPEPVDITTPDYCDARDSSNRALNQIYGDIVQAFLSTESLRQAPDWHAHAQIAYHRWALAYENDRHPPKGDDEVNFCKRFHTAWKKIKPF